MSANFPRTIHGLQNDNSRSALVAFAAAFVVGALWLAWVLFAHVAIYRTSNRARLMLGKSYEADATAEGRIIALHAELGEKIHRGEILAEIDAGSEERQVSEDRVRIAGMEAQTLKAESAIGGEQQAQDASRLALKASVAQSIVRWQDAVHSSEILADIAHRYELAHEAVSRVAALKALQEAQNAKAQAGALHLEIARIQKTAATDDSERTAEIQRLQQTRAQLIEEEQSARAEIQRLS